MNTLIVPEVVVTAIPEKQPYWVGYDQYLDCYLANDFLSPEEFGAMLPEEKRGYEAAQRHQADTETYEYLANTNAYGDRTEY
jgi:hypothetical protein